MKKNYRKLFHSLFIYCLVKLERMFVTTKIDNQSVGAFFILLQLWRIKSRDAAVPHARLHRCFLDYIILKVPQCGSRGLFNVLQRGRGSISGVVYGLLSCCGIVGGGCVSA
jgi:hypothetical protein